MQLVSVRLVKLATVTTRDMIICLDAWSSVNDHVAIAEMLNDALLKSVQLYFSFYREMLFFAAADSVIESFVNCSFN